MRILSRTRGATARRATLALLLTVAVPAMASVPGGCPHHDAHGEHGDHGPKAVEHAHGDDRGARSEAPVPCRCATACHLSAAVALPSAPAPFSATSPDVGRAPCAMEVLASPTPTYLLPLPNAPPASSVG